MPDSKKNKYWKAWYYKERNKVLAQKIEAQDAYISELRQKIITTQRVADEQSAEVEKLTKEIKRLKKEVKEYLTFSLGETIYADSVFQGIDFIYNKGSRK